MRQCAVAAALATAGAISIPAHALAAGQPTISASWATDVTSTSASLHAEVNPEGLEATYRFEYLTEVAYQANLGAGHEGFTAAAKAPPFGEEGLGSEATDQPALQHLVSLAPATTYRYRIVATNSSSPPGGTVGSVHAFTTQPNASFAPEECPNSQLRFEDNSFGLPDCRAYELVSPADKNGGAIQGFGGNSGGDVLQAAANGEAATYSSSASFAGGLGAPTASQYISRRIEGVGWATENITGPTASGAYGNANSGVPSQLFSTDLARGLLLNGRRCGEGEECPRSYSLRESAGGVLTPTPEEPDLRFAGSSPDLKHVVLSTCAKLTPEATEQPVCESGGPNLYEWSEGTLRLINRLGSDPLGTSDAHLAAQAGAISTDGSRVYFTVGEEAALYLREGEAGAKPVAELSSFQTASSDGSIAYYTTEQGASGRHLYRYEAIGEHTTDLTPSGGVEGVLGASADGSRVYYATAAGLFLWRAPGTTIEVAPSVEGIPAAEPGDYPPTTGTARLGADGSHLAFLSEASLTGYDNTDQSTGQPDSEVFLYSALTGGGEGTLTCVSCNPTGERPLGPSSIPGAIANGDLEEDPTATDVYKPRDLSTGGSRLFFDSRDAIVPGDGSAAQDVYEWEAPGAGGCAAGSPGFHSTSRGCLFLISSGASPEASSFIDASADGRDAFFLTADSLLPRDPGSVDLYDAREGGGVPEPEKEIECDGDACQSVPSPPEDPAPGTIVPGQPNPPVHFPKTRCKTGFVRKHGHCVKKPQHKKRHAHQGGHR